MGVPETGIAIVNLNWCSVIADAAGPLVRDTPFLSVWSERSMTRETFWHPALRVT